MRLILLAFLALLAGCASPAPDDGAALEAASVVPEAAAGAPVHAEGASSITVMAACVPAEPWVCAGTAPEWGTFSLDATAPAGTLTIEWTSPPNAPGGIRAYLMAADGEVASGSGESPLEVAAPPLSKGTYEVRVFPVASAGPASIEATWTYHAG